MVKSNRNVLPNTYIPHISKKILSQILFRLSKRSLIEFINLWPKLINTQPHIPQDITYTQNDLNGKVIREGQHLRISINKFHKKQIIDKIIYNYWYKGLNLLQLSQIDCQLLVDRPNLYYWNYSVVKNRQDHEICLSIDAKKFLNLLNERLGGVYLSYIYICRHPKLPMILIRIQVFDLYTKFSKQPHVTSNRAYLFGISLNSQYLIHQLSGRDMIYDLVMESIERSLPQNDNDLLTLVTPEQKPIKNLHSMHILKGVSRFGDCLGSWMIYADNSFDIIPLEPIEKHQEFSRGEKVEDDMNRLKQIASLRFKGTTSGKLKSKKLFEDNVERKTIQGDESDEEEPEEVRSEFTSIVPIQYSEFLIQEKVNNERTSIKLKLSGTDVFAGLHELCVSTTNPDEMIVNPEFIPSWLTGEEGASIGHIIDGKYYNLSI